MDNNTKKVTPAHLTLPMKSVMSAEATDPDRTIAEDDQNDNSSGNVEQKFERLKLTLKMVKGKKFGLGVILVHNRILVCKVDDDSLVCGILKVGDQIVSIDNIVVEDKIRCRKELMNGLNRKGISELVLIRPKTKDALDAIMTEIQLSKRPSQLTLKQLSPVPK
ncbi:unnamed protein product [Caenorhabditis angaria]|uniref:PDZ domain-containing protein n=1 Tax=Caenorhabditis angaria TaxID=860376 RepID=A0A9P1MY92_9PELO|nr:unnamed protein product [Caenorhabditis angaria]